MAAEPTDASIEKLLILTKAESMMDAVLANAEQNMRMGITRAAAAQPLTDEQRKALDGLPRKFAETMREELDWPTMKSMQIRIYKESFDQEDVDGLNEFYASKAGQALVNKMPTVMQRSMAIMQERMLPAIGRMAEAVKAIMTGSNQGK